MYDDDDYYDEPSPNEGKGAFIVIVGAFILMVFLIYTKYVQTYGV